jgi:hypothetical protein
MKLKFRVEPELGSIWVQLGFPPPKPLDARPPDRLNVREGLEGQGCAPDANL